MQVSDGTVHPLLGVLLPRKVGPRTPATHCLLPCCNDNHVASLQAPEHIKEFLSINSSSKEWQSHKLVPQSEEETQDMFLGWLRLTSRYVEHEATHGKVLLFTVAALPCSMNYRCSPRCLIVLTDTFGIWTNTSLCEFNKTKHKI